MNYDTVLPPPAVVAALLSFAAVMAITPGPNNLMLTASGVNFGLRRTVPHMAGILLGCVLVMLAVGLGLGVLLQTFPAVRIALQAGGIIYILWLAWKIATAGTFGGGGHARAHPFPMISAIAFQWINPKLWVMTVSAMAIYVRPGHAVGDVALVTGVITLVSIPTMLIWTGFGTMLRTVMQVPLRLRIFNIVMGLLLASTTLALVRL